MRQTVRARRCLRPRLEPGIAKVLAGVPGLRSGIWAGLCARADKFGVVAAKEALDDSGVLDGIDRSRVGVVLGAGTADLIRNETFYETTLTRGIRFARPSDAWNHFSSTPVDIIATRFGLEGLRSCIVAACSSLGFGPEMPAASRSALWPTNQARFGVWPTWEMKSRCSPNELHGISGPS